MPSPITKRRFMNKALIIDIDGTLANTDHRQHFLEGEKKNWKAFNDACADDTPNKWCVDLIQAMIAVHGVHPIFMTGRTMEYYDTTVHWIGRHIPTLKDLTLLMREDRNFEKDTVLKKRLYETNVKPEFDVLFVLEDRKQVTDMWRELGLVCLQCAEGDY